MCPRCGILSERAQVFFLGKIVLTQVFIPTDFMHVAIRPRTIIAAHDMDL
jgi:hypothetical protein